MEAPLLSLNCISAVLQGNTILNNISLTIIRGQHWVITGNSGAGKTSLLKAIAGIQGLSSGSVNYNFNKIKGNSQLPQSIAIVESKHQFKNGSNTTDLYYQQRYNSADAEDAPTVEKYLKSASNTAPLRSYWTLDKVVDRLGLTALYHKQLIKLSNGETKRLRLASALIKNPLLLLLDQPLTGLDINSRSDFDALLEEISASGITLVIATSADEVPKIVHHIAFLENGKLSEIVTQQQLKFKNPFETTTRAKFDATEINNLLNVASPAMFDTIIKMINVNVNYGDVAVLKNVNWEVKQGDRWALLGPNGAGKSTLLSLAYGDNPQAYANNIVLFDKKRGTGEEYLGY